VRTQRNKTLREAPLEFSNSESATLSKTIKYDQIRLPDSRDKQDPTRVFNLTNKRYRIRQPTARGKLLDGQLNADFGKRICD
jgi:hypothetical protein